MNLLHHDQKTTFDATCSDAYGQLLEVGMNAEAAAAAIVDVDRLVDPRGQRPATRGGQRTAPARRADVTVVDLLRPRQQACHRADWEPGRSVG
jgi:hypothetical protein